MVVVEVGNWPFTRTALAPVMGRPVGIVARGLVASRCNWLSWDEPPAGFECSVKIRYRGAAVAARVALLADGRAAVTFEEPQRAVCPGQAAVFYRGDEVLGGGWIEEASADDWMSTFSVNLFHAVNVIRAAIPGSGKLRRT